MRIGLGRIKYLLCETFWFSLLASISYISLRRNDINAIKRCKQHSQMSLKEQRLFSLTWWWSHHASLTHTRQICPHTPYHYCCPQKNRPSPVHTMSAAVGPLANSLACKDCHESVLVLLGYLRQECKSSFQFCILSCHTSFLPMAEELLSWHLWWWSWTCSLHIFIAAAPECR